MEKEIALLKKRLERERLARKQAEQILEDKALELYNANNSLRKLNESLEDKILIRTEALQHSEKKFRAVVDQASDIIYSADLNGYITFVNSKGTEAFGYSKDEIIGNHFIEFVDLEYKESLLEYYIKIREKKKTEDYFEFPILSKSGEKFWIGQNINKILHSDGTYYYNAVARDITLRKKTESQLEQARSLLLKSEVKYRSALENMDLGLMEVDLEGKIIRVYDRFCTMIGYSKEELIGKDAVKTLIVSGYEKVLKQNDKTRLKGKSSIYEVKLKRKSGEEIWVLISGAPFYNEQGNVIGSLGIHYDITDRKNLEANLEIAKEKAILAQQAEQQFLANMSHEIRTPLNAIIGMAHLIKDTKINQEQSEYIEILNNSASLLKNLVSDILDISKIDSGKIDQNNIDFNINSLVKKLKQTFRQKAFDKSIAVNIHLDEKLSLVYTDQNWLSQILLNLISNAIKFTQVGEVNIKTDVLKETNEYSSVYFEVSDTGIGLDEKEVISVFEEFKQANNKIRREFGGTGLGLSIAYKLVQLLGGQLRVNSKKNIGSTFYFTLKLKKSNKNKLELTENKGNRPSIEGLNILVVEDNKMNQKYVSTLLDKWNINYTIVENGLDAVNSFSSKFDLIFMDLSMPIMNGYEATKQIREKEIDNKTPIIALTASTFLSKKQLALQAGMTDFIAKPFTPDELYNIIQKYNKIEIFPSEKIEKFQFDPSLNNEILEKLYQSDYSYAYEMFNTFLEEIEDELKIMNDAANNLDNNKLKKCVHKIKPMFSMIGVPKISELCEKIENNESENLTQSIHEIVKEINIQSKIYITIVGKDTRRLFSFIKVKNND